MTQLKRALLRFSFFASGSEAQGRRDNELASRPQGELAELLHVQFFLLGAFQLFACRVWRNAPL